MTNNPAPPQVRFGDWISEGWKMFTEQWKGWVTVSLGFFLAIVVPIGAFLVVMYGMMFATMTAAGPRGGPPEIPMVTILLLYLGMFGLILVLMPLTVLLMGGSYRAAFKQLRGGRVEFRDLFSARDCYWRLLGAVLVQSVLVTLGTMLCVVPGFIVAGLLFFTVPLIVERNMGVFEAMRASRDATQPNLLMFTLFAFVVQLIASAGSYACYVGLLATIPLMFTIGVIAYRDCFGVPGARSFLQPAPPQTGYEAAPVFSTYTEPPPVHPPFEQSPPFETPFAQTPFEQEPPFETPFAQSPFAQAPPVEPPPESALVCANCQTSLPATAQFCPTCGSGVTR